MVVLHRGYSHGISRCFVYVYSPGFPRRFQYLAHPSWKTFSRAAHGRRCGRTCWFSRRLGWSIFRLLLNNIWLEGMVVGTCPYNYGCITLIQCIFSDSRCDIELWTHIHFASVRPSLAMCNWGSTPIIKVGYHWPTWWSCIWAANMIAGTQTARANDAITSHFPCSLGSSVSCLRCPPWTR